MKRIAGRFKKITNHPYLVVWNGVLPEEIRRDEAHLVAEEGRTVLEQRWKEAHGHPLEAPSVLRRDAVPSKQEIYISMMYCMISSSE